MIPQDRIIIVAKVTAGRLDALRSLLKTMTLNGAPGMADPANALVPFGNFDNIHFARFVVLADNTLGDLRDYPEIPGDKFDPYLCFMVDCDGDADDLLPRMAQGSPRMKEIFAHCEGFDQAADLLGWMRKYRAKPVASYVNWVGRSVVQVNEETRLHNLLRSALPSVAEVEPQQIFARLKSVSKSVPLTPVPPTPLTWRIRNLLHMLLPFAIAAACLLIFPLVTIAVLCVGAVVFVLVLRRHEQTLACFRL